MSVNSFAELIDLNGWLDVPKTIISREGHPIDASQEVWHLPYIVRGNTSIDFGKIIEPGIRWVTQRYIQDRLEVTSTHAGFTAFTYLWTEIFRYQGDLGVVGGIEPKSLKENLISLFEMVLSEARKSHRLWAMYRPIQWYVWCAEHYSELGFCPVYALELDTISIPGNPKGEAVRMEDPDQGPLHRSLELPLLIEAMRSDKSTELSHLQEKAVLALSIALGRNPANLTFLKESDLINLTAGADDPTWIIRMPRIKKRQLNPRDDMLDEYLDPEFAGYLLELIEANKGFDAKVEGGGKLIEIARPLFINLGGNKSAILSGLIDSSFNMTSEAISGLLKRFVRRHKIISPLTGGMLQINTRRLRYTLGTALAAEGISRRELARILDHTDTQHVEVYFELAGSIVEHLDKATAKNFAKYINNFKGVVIEKDAQAVNGERHDKHLFFINESTPEKQTDIGVCGQDSICHLDPPFSCYLCEKFQPYRHANHEYVLECLLRSREERMEKYESARLGIQLDHVIMAVANVISLCERREENV